MSCVTTLPCHNEAVNRGLAQAVLSHLEAAADLIVEFSTPYARSPFSSIRWVTSLHHESFEVAVEEGAVVDACSCEGEEVLAGLGSRRYEELQLEVAQRRV